MNDRAAAGLLGDERFMECGEGAAAVVADDLGRAAGSFGFLAVPKSEQDVGMEGEVATEERVLLLAGGFVGAEVGLRDPGGAGEMNDFAGGGEAFEAGAVLRVDELLEVDVPREGQREAQIEAEFEGDFGAELIGAGGKSSEQDEPGMRVGGG
jgi:hypothetical protein